MEEAGVMGRLSSASKLDRDKAIRQLSEAVEKKEGEVIETVLENLLGIRDRCCTIIDLSIFLLGNPSRNDFLRMWSIRPWVLFHYP